MSPIGKFPTPGGREAIGRKEAKRLLRREGINPERARALLRALQKQQRAKAKRTVRDLVDEHAREDA
jgi:hypothetical protein